MVLFALWSLYKEYLTQGMKPPESTQRVVVMESEGMPDLDLKTLSGAAERLSQYKGKVILLNLWASWCEPCVTEIPSMLRLAKKFSEDVVILAVSADNDKDSITGFLKAYKEHDLPNVRIFWDQDGSVARTLGTIALPETYIIGRNFKLERKVVGGETWDTPLALDFFKYLSEKPRPN